MTSDEKIRHDDDREMNCMALELAFWPSCCCCYFWPDLLGLLAESLVSSQFGRRVVADSNARLLQVGGALQTTSGRPNGLAASPLATCAAVEARPLPGAIDYTPPGWQKLNKDAPPPGRPKLASPKGRPRRCRMQMDSPKTRLGVELSIVCAEMARRRLDWKPIGVFTAAAAAALLCVIEFGAWP